MQDPVPKMGKFGVLYARPGQRVILDPGGEMQVRPTHLDRRLASLNPCKWPTCIQLSPVFTVHDTDASCGLLQLLAYFFTG